ncbi:MAG: hypothetical protein ACFFB7_09060, partial [Candidatus Sifarchaeia archaeon]
FGATVIEKGVKLDNHVHIGHNCRVGKHPYLDWGEPVCSDCWDREKDRIWDILKLKKEMRKEIPKYRPA